MTFSLLIVVSLVLVSNCQNITFSIFIKGPTICDITDRLVQGCSLEIVDSISFVQCVTLCGRNVTCIGSSYDNDKRCFLHQDCPQIHGCAVEDTSHKFMAKNCGVGKVENSVVFCECDDGFSCHARTCSEWRERGFNFNTYAIIDPDGRGIGTNDPEVVYCDMTSFGGVGVTVIGHDSQERTHVIGYEAARSYQVVLTYNMSFDQVISLVDQSKNCRQHIRWECHDAVMYMYQHETGWLNRSMLLADYFGEADPGSHQCTCGKTNTCDPGVSDCNCNGNDLVWRVDEGYLSRKDDLPMYGFVAGDTGGPDENGYHTFGPLLCWGSE